MATGAAAKSYGFSGAPSSALPTIGRFQPQNSAQPNNKET